MFFQRKKKSDELIVKLTIGVNLNDIPFWLKHDCKLEPQQFSHDADYIYEISILPVSNNREWFFHKTANEYSHGLKATINLDDYFDDKTVINQFCRYGPSLEIEMWNGQLWVHFSGHSLLMAPLNEYLHLRASGNTSLKDQTTLSKIIQVPDSFEGEGSNRKVSSYREIYETLTPWSASYSTDMAYLSIGPQTFDIGI